MIISKSPPFTMPRRLETPKPPVAPAQPVVARKHPVFPMPTQGLYGVHVGAPAAVDFTSDKSVEVIRQVCSLIANHVGGKTRIVNQVIWLSFDASHLVEQFKDPEAGGVAKGVAVTQFAAGALDLASNVPGWDGLQRGVLPLYFSADLGDRIETGRCEITLGDLAEYSEDPQAEMVKLTELLK